MAGDFDEWAVGGLAEQAAKELIHGASSLLDVSRRLAVVVSEDNALLFLQNRTYHRSENKTTGFSVMAGGIPGLGG